SPPSEEPSEPGDGPGGEVLPGRERPRRASSGTPVEGRRESLADEALDRLPPLVRPVVSVPESRQSQFPCFEVHLPPLHDDRRVGLEREAQREPVELPRRRRGG